MRLRTSFLFAVAAAAASLLLSGCCCIPIPVPDPGPDYSPAPSAPATPPPPDPTPPPNIVVPGWTPPPPAPVPDPVTAVRLDRVRLEPWTNPSGRQMAMVYIDWTNTGQTPIGEVHASIVVKDREGNTLQETDEFCVFVAETDAGCVQPGDRYIEPRGEGHTASFAFGMPHVAHVEIKRIESGPWRF